GVWEGRNGARSQQSNELACRIAATMNGERAAALANRHGIEPAHGGRIALTGGSDDHGALDIATTWTDAAAPSIAEFLSEVQFGWGGLGGDHGSTAKLAHALTALAVNAYRAGGGSLPKIVDLRAERLFDTDADDPHERHHEISETMTDLSRLLGERAR